MSMSWASRAVGRLRQPGTVTESAPLVADDRPASGALPTLAEPERLRLSGTAMLLVGIVLLGFVVQFAGASQLSFVRDQQIALQDFRFDLANGTAPVGQAGTDGLLIPEGTPVALLDVPAAGIDALVVGEGTTSTVTAAGPGHRRDTVLPGQEGASVVYGRQAAYGGPFRAIDRLVVGDQLTATTSQGAFSYRIIAVRRSGEEIPPQLAPGQSRLTLVSTVGPPFLPSGIIRVDADLEGAVAPTPERVLGAASITAAERPMAGQTDLWPMLLLAVLLLGFAAVVLTLSRRYWGRWQTWIVGVPVLAAIGVLAAQQASVLLPNLM
jgi:sortase A